MTLPSLRRIHPSWSGLAGCFLLSLACALPPGCADGEVRPRTQVMVVMEAEAEVVKRLRELEVNFYGREPGQDEWKKADTFSRSFGAESFEPVRLALVPADPTDPGEFRVEARARDDEGETFLQVEVTSGYVRGRTLRLDVLLRDECLNRPEGRCPAQRVNPMLLADLDSGTDAMAEDAGLDATSLDAGGGEGGVEGGTNDDAGREDASATADARVEGGTDAASPDADAGCRVDADCDDGNLCNGEERCEAGSCVEGDDLVCDQSDNVCVTYMCLPKKGCVELLHNGDGCDDEDACTAEDMCQGGTCQGEPLQCEDNQVCEAGSCGCADGYEDCGSGVCEEVGTRCECGGTWECGDGARVCGDQRGECAGQLDMICAEEDCPRSCLLNQGRRCEQNEDNTACEWSGCALGIL